MITIDINCDLGESFGAYQIGNDEQLLKYITSANIACGFHAGDYNIMGQTVKKAVDNQVAIGAHPGFQDIQGFGRREMQMKPNEIYDLTLYQLGALKGFCSAMQTKMNHVKPHGALYNMAAKDSEIADAIVNAIVDFDKTLLLYGLSGSKLIRAGQKYGLKTASEVFADRTYQKDGTLTPRSFENAVHKDVDAALNQAMMLIKENEVRTVDGELISLDVDTLCIHGDNPLALTFVKKLGEQLDLENIIMKRID
jgi:5-oxoprolinase (ATP-hydrolysing) subunit A